MDGACDGPDEEAQANPNQPCSLLPLQPQPARLSKVRFLSDDNLRSRRNSVAPPEEMASQQRTNAFINPFSGEGSTLSRRTSTSSDVTDYLRPNAFAGHRDTLARLPHPVSLHTCNETIWEDDSASDDSESECGFVAPRGFRKGSAISPVFPRRVIDIMLLYLSFQDYKNLRLVCRRWKSELPRPSFRAVYRLPQELVQQIYSYLRPCDFDAACHSCRAWYLASIDWNVQELMLQLSSNRNALLADLRRVRSTSAHGMRKDDSQVTTAPGFDDGTLDKEWICSKRLATESRLSADWHGPVSGDDPTTSRLSNIEDIDFSKLLHQEKLPARRVFTVSACGEFVLVVSGGDILVYKLWGGEQSMVSVVRLAPGIQVLDVSMDTSSERYSVAALLEGRVGMLWDINIDAAETRQGRGSGEPLNLGLQADVQCSASVLASRPLAFNLPMRSRELLAADADDYEVSPLAMLSGTSSPGFVPSPPFLWDEHIPGHVHRQHGLSTGDSDDEYPGVRIPIQTRPTAIYTDLGSSDDLPRSVAICPNRKCVAFGCRLGIELHWVNALTGGDLNRWFPLAAPSDHLYFLPRRPGIDSRKKLRLISSAAGQASMRLQGSDGPPVTWIYWPTSIAPSRRQSLTRLFFGNLPFPASVGPPDSWSESEPRSDGDEGQAALRTVDCDHFRAVPISDGVHLLFTDPSTGLLCLGSDAPFGGPTKLIRKVMFTPPSSEEGQRSRPLLYSAGQALEWGLRVVAFHADGQIVLYIVPADILQEVQAWQTTGAWGRGTDPQMNVNPAPPMAPNGTSGSGQTPANRSVHIAGALISRVEKGLVDDLAVHSEGGSFSLWIFYRSGRAELRTIYAPGGKQTIYRYVGDDGLVYEAQNTPQSEIEEDRGQRSERASKGKTSRDTGHVKWIGVDGASDQVPVPECN